MAGSRAGAKSFGLPAFRAVEDDPHHKIVREIFEAVLDARWHEQYVAGAEGMAVRPVDERPVSTDHHVHFVAGMRRLRVGAAGRVDLDLHATVFEYSANRSPPDPGNCPIASVTVALRRPAVVPPSFILSPLFG